MRYKFIPTKRDKHVFKYQLQDGTTRYMYKGYVGTDLNGKKKWSTKMGFKTLNSAVSAWHKAQTVGTSVPHVCG